MKDSEAYLALDYAFFCEDVDSPGFCVVQCTLCKARATKDNGGVQGLVDEEKLAIIRRIRSDR
jgi:hypothetical protein